MQQLLGRLEGMAWRLKRNKKRLQRLQGAARIIQGGFIVGGQYGEGALIRGTETQGHYRIAGASFGLLAGAQTSGIAITVRAISSGSIPGGASSNKMRTALRSTRADATTIKTATTRLASASNSAWP